MHTSTNSCRIALALLLSAMTGACAHRRVPNAGAASLSPYSATIGPQPAAPEAKEILQAGGHGAPPAIGFIVHIDPLTGQILPEPPAPDQSQALERQQLQSAPIEPLPAIATPTPVPGGGVKVKLNRQFNQTLFATIGADGKIKVEHRPPHAEAEIK
ncbi:MAG TPA: hypothetical protein VHM64_13025 [Candidatus Binatia bacterium]|nr:hypothetical protein [Candidatus Binatia bacterium]